MARMAVRSIFCVALALGFAVAASAARVSNPYGVARTETRADEVELSVDIAAAYELPDADPFDVDIICIDASGIYKWQARSRVNQPLALNLVGRWHSASYYGVESDIERGLAFTITLPAPLVDPDDRLLISIDDDALSAPGPIFTISIDPYHTQPLRMDVLSVALSVNDQGNLVVTAANQTHVPLVVPLAGLVLALTPTPDWIPDTAPDLRWVPDPPLSAELLVVGDDAVATAVLPFPALPDATLAAYRNVMSAVYQGLADAYPGDYLAVGFPVAWGISWAYLAVGTP